MISARGAVVAGGVVAVVVGAAALRAGDPVGEVLRLAEWIRAQGGWGWGVVVALQMVVCLTGILPASVLVVVAGSLYGLWYGFFLSSVATLLGAVSAFLAGRFLIGPVLSNWVGRSFRVGRINEGITDGGWRLAILLRMSPIFPFALASYGFGLSNIRVRDFVIGNLGSLPALFALAYTGAVARDVAALVAGEKEGRNLVESGVLILGLLATVAVVGLLTRMTYGIVRKQGLTEDPRRGCGDRR